MTSARMRMMTVPLLVLTLGVLTVHARQDKKVDDANSNALLLEYKGKVKISASTYWPGWEPTKAIDRNVETSWFTNRGDAAALGTEPWIEVELPVNETVRRITFLGNREPSWPTDFSILEGVIQLLDEDRKLLWADEAKAAGKDRDFDFRPEKPVGKVRYIRFRSTKDEGDRNGYEDVALAEIQIE